MADSLQRAFGNASHLWIIVNDQQSIRSVVGGGLWGAWCRRVA
ncbi:hypothetical protein [Gemmatimonas sp.]